MDLAISLAEDRVGLTGSNPSVGCVIVDKSQIISVGQTGIGGTPHAETVAIKSAKKEDRLKKYKALLKFRNIPYDADLFTWYNEDL